jgi:hypothetical protein
MARPTRRDLLRGLGAAGLAAACDPRDVALPDPIDRGDPTAPWPGAATPDASVPHAAVGDPAPGALRLVARTVGDGPFTVALAVWEGGAWSPRDPVSLPVDADGYGAIELTGLPADAAIAWQVASPTGGSAVGHARTLPAADAAVPLRLAASSCSDHAHEDFPALITALGRGPVDLYVGLGDTVYADGAYGLPAYRAFWDRAMATSGYRALFESASVAFTWDDHEVVNDFAGATADPVQLANGLAAMLEAVPIRLDPAHPGRLWRRFSWGRTADLFLLDVRGERDPDAGRYVSDEQLQWLIDGVTTSTATWKVVFTQVPITEFTGALAAPLFSEDRWQGAPYAEQRRALLDAIGAVRGLLFITGDHHFPAIIRPDPSGAAAATWELLTGPLGSNRTPIYAVLEFGPDLPWAAQVWCCHRVDLHPSGYAAVTVIGEEDETWFDGLLDDEGRLLAWTHTPDPLAPADLELGPG